MSSQSEIPEISKEGSGWKEERRKKRQTEAGGGGGRTTHTDPGPRPGLAAVVTTLMGVSG